MERGPAEARAWAGTFPGRARRDHRGHDDEGADGTRNHHADDVDDESAVRRLIGEAEHHELEGQRVDENHRRLRAPACEADRGVHPGFRIG